MSSHAIFSTQENRTAETSQAFGVAVVESSTETLAKSRALNDELKKTEIYQKLLARIDYHIKICERQIDKYGSWAQRMRLFLPLLSATATGLATIAASLHSVQGILALTLAWSVAGVSFVATVFSALNSAVKPSNQWQLYVRYINKFWHALMQIDFDLNNVALHFSEPKRAEQELHNCLLIRNAEVEALIIEFSDASNENFGAPQQQAPAGDGVKLSSTAGQVSN